MGCFEETAKLCELLLWLNSLFLTSTEKLEKNRAILLDSQQAVRSKTHRTLNSFNLHGLNPIDF